MDGEPVGVYGQNGTGLQFPAVAVADVMAKLPSAARVLSPILRVVTQSESETGTAAAHRFDQREAEVEITRAQVDLLAGRAPIGAVWADADLARVDAAGRGCGDGDAAARRRVDVVIHGRDTVGISGS